VPLVVRDFVGSILRKRSPPRAPRYTKELSWNFETLNFETLNFETPPFLRCLEQRLTMCNVVVIIKQFRELGLACLYTAVLSDAQPALAAGSGKILAEL
jgi:hypothetical protein